MLRTFVLPQLKQHLDFMEGELGKREWFAGEEFSAADIQMSFPLEAAAARRPRRQSRPQLWASCSASTRGRRTSARSNAAAATSFAED